MTEGLYVTPDYMGDMFGRLLANPTDLFMIEDARRILARKRWEDSGKNLRIHENPAEGVMPGTIAHNRQELDQNLFGSSKRSTRLLGPLSALDPVYARAPELKVLSIGPRTEMELLHLMGIGFLPANISAIDLISSSPLITPGDMHALPYLDHSFDVVISSWVLNYSKTPQQAVDEMLRVTKDGGLIAMGVTHSPGVGDGTEITDAGETEIVGSMVHSSWQLAAMLGESLKRSRFQFEPPEGQKGPVMLIAEVKH